MLVTIINGSPRKRGATGKILGRTADFLRNKGDVEVNYVDLSDFDMKFCKGCAACFRTGSCIIRDDGLEELSLLVGRSDGVIIGSPTFESNVHGRLKNFMDRGHFVLEQLLTDKYCFAVSTYENAQGSEALKILKRLFVFSGGILSGKLLIKLDFNQDPFSIRGIQAEFDKKMGRFYKDIKGKRKKNISERLVSWVILNIGMKPGIIKHRERYAGVIGKWARMGLVRD